MPGTLTGQLNTELLIKHVLHKLKYIYIYFKSTKGVFFILKFVQKNNPGNSEITPVRGETCHEDWCFLIKTPYNIIHDTRIPWRGRYSAISEAIENQIRNAMWERYD